MENFESRNSIEKAEEIKDSEYYETIRAEVLVWLATQKPENPHLPLIKTGELLNKLLEVFDRFQKGEITMDEFIDLKAEYINSVEEELREQGKEGEKFSEALENDSGIVFLALLSNKFNTPENTEERLKREN